VRLKRNSLPLSKRTEREIPSKRVNCNFEMGPIRPPSEATSILIRLTRNCPWNKCAFCPVYKGEKFSRRPVDEIISDIDSIYFITDQILHQQSQSDEQVLFGDISLEGIESELIRKVMYWLSWGMKSVFLQDADSLVLKTADVVKVLNHLKERFSSVERITTYARARTVSRKSLDELKLLKDAGLNRIHIGMESGSDSVLNLLEKGVSSAEQVDAGLKSRSAGFELSEYFMPGLGGAEYTGENARESARVLNMIDPDFIRLRSTIPVPGTPLHRLMDEGRWKPLTEIEKVKEIRLFIENLEGISSEIHSDHIMNLLEDVHGKFPADKQKMLDTMDSFLDMNEDERESFIIGRRTGRIRFLADLRPDPEIDKIKLHIKENFNSIEEAMLALLRNYI
jgi:radical SAM superfamily enzyme YgiQ (UPF0313 family)